MWICVESNVTQEWTWCSNESFEMWARRWVQKAARGVGSSEVQSIYFPELKLSSLPPPYFKCCSYYIAGRQAEGFIAVAVESDEWQATRGPRSELKKG